MASASFELALKLPSLANKRMHYFAKAKIVKSQRSAGGVIAAKLARQLGANIEFDRLRVKFVRVGPRRLDSDNLANAFKGIRDGIASWFEIDDGDPIWIWEYEQAQGKPAVRVTLTTETD